MAARCAANELHPSEQTEAAARAPGLQSTVNGERLLYGLQRLPRTLTVDDTRLPGVELRPTPLRLNSIPLPPSAWGSGETDHATRMASMRSWLLDRCGDYNATLRHGITRYLDAIAAHVAHHRDVLAANLAPFHGLYREEDWCWSALRPMPHAWWRQDESWVSADLAFWDGNAVIAVSPQAFDTGTLPTAFHRFWDGQILPVSPFRREFPAGPSAALLRPSSR